MKFSFSKSLWVLALVGWASFGAWRAYGAEPAVSLKAGLYGNVPGLTIDGEVGLTCEVQRLDALLSATNQWRFLACLELPQSPYLWMDYSATGAVQRYYRVLTIPPGLSFVPAGAFQMGDSFSEGYADERPVHTVLVSGFYIERREVARALWDDVRTWAGTNGYYSGMEADGKSAEHPAHTMSWHGAVRWCNARSEREGLKPVYYADPALTQIYRAQLADPYADWSASGYRLPTEAEWEKAARGGVAGRRFSWPDTNTITHSRANYYSSASFSYDISPTRGYHPLYEDGDLTPYTSPVGSFPANGYGLFDMTGNVMEWCWDWFDSGWYASPAASQNDPRGPSGPATYRVLRGGSWFNYPGVNRCAYRIQGLPANGSFTAGFRCVRRPQG